MKERIKIRIASDDDDSTLASLTVELSSSFSYGFPTSTDDDDLKILEAVKSMGPDFSHLDKFRVYVQAVAVLDEDEGPDWRDIDESEQRKWYVDTDPSRVNSLDTAGWEVMDF
jgi:hypothetical protein